MSKVMYEIGWEHNEDDVIWIVCDEGTKIKQLSSGLGSPYIKKGKVQDEDPGIDFRVFKTNGK